MPIMSGIMKIIDERERKKKQRQKKSKGVVQAIVKV